MFGIIAVLSPAFLQSAYFHVWNHMWIWEETLYRKHQSLISQQPDTSHQHQVPSLFLLFRWGSAASHVSVAWGGGALLWADSSAHVGRQFFMSLIFWMYWESLLFSLINNQCSDSSHTPTGCSPIQFSSNITWSYHWSHRLKIQSHRLSLTLDTICKSQTSLTSDWLGGINQVG